MYCFCSEHCSQRSTILREVSRSTPFDLPRLFFRSRGLGALKIGSRTRGFSTRSFKSVLWILLKTDFRIALHRLKMASAVWSNPMSIIGCFFIGSGMMPGARGLISSFYCIAISSSCYSWDIYLGGGIAHCGVGGCFGETCPRDA